MSRERDLHNLRQWVDNGDYDKAANLCYGYLKTDPEDAPFLTILGAVMLQTHKPAIGYSLTKRACQLAPKVPGVWMNHGQACSDLWKDKEAERCYKKALKLAVNDDQRSMLCVNMASVLIDTGRFEEAEPWCERAIQLNSGSVKGVANLGFCQLAQRKWAEGWKNYRKCLGSEWRVVQQYNGEPTWEGQKGKIVLYGEQGIGDQISFASMVPDAAKDNEIILDVEERLRPLFQRSFPNVKVYGTRLAKVLDWDEADRNPDYSLPMGQIGEFYRLNDRDFPGTSYLKPCPDRLFMWQSLFKRKKKPVIGIAWRGGIAKTGARFRQWDLEQLLPILKSVDAHWVSLQYKPAGKEIAEFKKAHPEIDIVEYPHATLTQDYDDTAALVAALDHVVTMQTTIVHTAGGLGIPCWAHVPMNSQWRYGAEGEDFLWAKSVRIFRQKKRGYWDDVINETAERLSAHFNGLRGAAKKAPQHGKLRGSRGKVRANGRWHDRPAGDQPRT